jgi:hypothetical protein
MDAQSGGEEVGNTGTAVGGRGRTSSAGMGSSGHRSRAGPARESHALQRGRLAWGEHSGLRVPAVRVRIDAVSAWWPGHGEQIKGATGWFAFVSVPAGN